MDIFVHFARGLIKQMTKIGQMDHNFPLPVPCSLAFRTFNLSPVFRPLFPCSRLQGNWKDLNSSCIKVVPKLIIFVQSLALYYLEGNLLKVNIITGQFFFFTNLFISVWSSLPTLLCSDDSLNPLCLHLSSMPLWIQQLTGNMSLVIGAHHFYLVPVPNLTRVICTAFSFPYFL